MTRIGNSAVIGLQWGNEGKGPLLDFMTISSDVIVRYRGCSSSGRTINVGRNSIKVRYVPRGIAQSGKKCLISGGAFLDMEKMTAEIAALKEAGALNAEFVISPHCHVVLDYHKKLDVLDHRMFGMRSGTAIDELGLCAACADKCRGLGIRAEDLLSRNALYEKIEQNLAIKNEYLMKVYGERGLDAEALYDKCLKHGEALKPYIGDTARIIELSMDKGIAVLFEGSGGAMNDIDGGIYPYVSPCSSALSSVMAGTGVTPKAPLWAIGVIKSYSTRSDEGPFLTEETGAVAPFIRSRGCEISDITGKARRVGWLDIPALKYALLENPVDAVAVTKLDVLTGVDEIRICMSYMLDGKEKKCFDTGIFNAEYAAPVYRTMSGWKEDISGCCSFKSLPLQAQAYIKFIEDSIAKPVVWVGCGRHWADAIIRY